MQFSKIPPVWNYLLIPYHIDLTHDDFIRYGDCFFWLVHDDDLDELVLFVNMA
jgi:hypothetical protein